MARFSTKSIFIRLLISFLALIVLTLLFSSLIIYRNYVSGTIQESSAESERLLSGAAGRTETNLDWADMHAFELYGNNDVFSAIYSREVSALDEYNAQKILSYAMNSNPLIYSAYLYNGNLDQFFSNFTYRHASDAFFDQGIVGILRQLTSSQFRYIPRTIQYEYYGKRYREDVISIVINDPQPNNGPVNGALVLNIKASAISEDNPSGKNSKDMYLMIVDKDNRVISHSLPGFFLKDLSGEKYIEKVNISPNASGFFTEMISGKKYLLTYVKSDKLDWSFIQVSLYSELFEKTNGLRNLIIILSGLLFIVSALLASFLSWKFYSPIGRLVHIITKDAENAEKAGAAAKDNEIEYITRAYQGIINNIRLLRQETSNNKEFLRKELLKDLVTTGMPANMILESKFKELDIDLAINDLQVVLFRIDDYWNPMRKVNGREDIALLRSAISNIAEEVLLSSYRNVAVDMGDDLVLAVLNPHDGPQNTDATLQNSVRRTQSAIKEHFQLGISVSIGSVAEKPSELPRVFRHALDMSNYRLVFGKECVLLPDMIKENLETCYSYDEKLEKDILDGLRLSDYPAIEAKTDRFFKNLYCLAYEHIMISLSRLLYSSIEAINKTYAQKGYEFNYNELQSEMALFDTLGEMKEWLLGIYKQYIHNLSNSPQTVKLDHIRKIEDIVCGEYGNPNLSTEGIATRLHLSTNYIREIFKEYKGVSVSGYINDRRCEVAKELLAKSNWTIQKICEQVGIANENYFYTLFRKNCGLTPVQFRKRSGRRENG